MDQAPRAINWEAPEHPHTEKGADWFFAFTIIIIAIVVAAIMLGNSLFALLIGIAGITLAISAARRPAIIPFGVSVRGVRIGEELHPYTTIDSYYIDETNTINPQMILKVKRRFMPLIVIPIPVDHIDDIEDLVREKLPEEHLEESLFLKILEIFGF